MTEEQERGKEKHQGEGADEMGPEQRPLGPAAVAPPPLQHGADAQGWEGTAGRTVLSSAGSVLLFGGHVLFSHVVSLAVILSWSGHPCGQGYAH